MSDVVIYLLVLSLKKQEYPKPLTTSLSYLNLRRCPYPTFSNPSPNPSPSLAHP